jgi:hypothetical protein
MFLFSDIIYIYIYIYITLLFLPEFYILTNYVKTFENQIFNSFSPVYFMKFSTLYNKLFFSNKNVFQRS